MADVAALEPIARALIAKHGGAKSALPHLRRLLMKRSDLLDALALAYLETLAQPSPGPSFDDAHLDIAGSAAADQRMIDAQRRRVGGGDYHPPIKPIKVREHRRARARTDDDRQIEIVAMTKNITGAYERLILNYPIGDYRWRELPDLLRTLTLHTVDYLMLGKDAAEAAVLIRWLLDYAVVSDLNERVRDVVPEDALTRGINESARAYLPKLDVSKGAAHVAFVQQLEYRS